MRRVWLREIIKTYEHTLPAVVDSDEFEGGFEGEGLLIEFEGDANRL